MTGRNGGARTRALLAVGAGVLASLAFAGQSYAATPTTGSNCQVDGKIDGGGATFQTNVHVLVFEPAFQSDICGPVAGGGPGPGAATEAGNKMVLYNYLARSNRATPLTGSGSGINGAICRVEAFSGSDVPYTTAQLARMRGTSAPTDSECTAFNGGFGGNTNPTFDPPFQPTGAPYPDPADAQNATIMSFPIAGGAVAMGVNLPATACGGTAPTAINLSTANASALWGGRITQWNDPALVADNASLANCAVAVTRVVRSDGSGTTTIFKNYLANADGATAQCDGRLFNNLRGQAGGATAWPNGGTCSPINVASGNPAVVDGTAAVVGGLGYGDLSDWRTRQSQIVLANLRNSDNSAYVSPLAGTGSNCSFSGAALPTGGTAGAVGLGSTGWASDAVPSRADVTYRGTGYPSCGFTWALVRTGLSTGSGGSVSRLNANQRRTLYSYMLFALTPAAQSRLSSNYYAPIPSNFLSQIRTGFINGF